jgi:hypothetical protein
MSELSLGLRPNEMDRLKAGEPVIIFFPQGEYNPTPFQVETVVVYENVGMPVLRETRTIWDNATTGWAVIDVLYLDDLDAKLIKCGSELKHCVLPFTPEFNQALIDHGFYNPDPDISSIFAQLVRY